MDSTALLDALLTAVPWAGTPLWLLALARLSGTLAMTPVFAAAPVPMPVRACVLAAFSVVLAGLVPRPSVALPPLGLALAGPLLTELAFGALLGLGIQLAFTAMAVGARVLDVQMGYGMGQVMDPATRTQLPVLSAAFNRLALLLFVLMDGLHGVLRGLALSFERVPLGSAWPLDIVASTMTRQVAAQYSLGFAIAAPMAACLLLTELGLATVARSAPQMNVFMLGLPLKVCVGLACLAAWLPGQLSLVQRIHGTLFRGWEVLFQ